MNHLSPLNGYFIGGRMIHITKKSSCCGCTACFNICPKNAISMQPDEEGFLYPVVDQREYINQTRINLVR